MDGFININKCKGVSSHDVVAAVRRLLYAKTGHAGTLDPGASGVLPICLGKATRLSEYITMYQKVYRGDIVFGITTDSYDKDGKVIENKPAGHLVEADILNILPQFIGDIMQVPPMVSALKHEGKPLYKLAREGKIIDIKPRPVSVYEIKYIAGDFSSVNPRISLEIKCSKGTYIRSIAHDIGQSLGVGAYLAELCRISVGPFVIDEAFSIEEIARMVEEKDYSFLLSLKYGTGHLPLVIIKEDNINKILHGNELVLPDEKRILDICRVEDQSGRLLGIGRLIQSENGVVIKMKKVLAGME